MNIRNILNQVFNSWFPNRIISVINIDYGHELSKREQKSVDAQGNPIPWFTYPAIDYLSQLNLKNRIIFEWGSGASSEYFAKRCKYVYSVEHDKEWYVKVNALKQKNQLIICAKGNKYVEGIAKVNRKFDIIIVDGIRRDECTKKSVLYLKNNGIIILDNSERHSDTCKWLRRKGFIQIDFIGFGPIANITWSTSVFITQKFDYKPLDFQPRKTIGGEL